MYYSTTYLSPLGKITLACDACGKKSCRLMAGRAKVLSGYAEGSFD